LFAEAKLDLNERNNDNKNYEQQQVDESYSDPLANQWVEHKSNVCICSNKAKKILEVDSSYEGWSVLAENQNATRLEMITVPGQVQKYLDQSRVNPLFTAGQKYAQVSAHIYTR